MSQLSYFLVILGNLTQACSEFLALIDIGILCYQTNRLVGSTSSDTKAEYSHTSLNQPMHDHIP